MDKQNGAPATSPVARIVSDKPRTKTVPLEYPVEFKGEVINEITLSRVTAKEVDDYIEAAGQKTEGLMPPVVKCAREVWDALDADDQWRIDQIAWADFFPLRLKDLRNRIESMPDTSDASSGS